MTDINKHIGAEKINQIPNLNFEGGKKNIAAPKNYTEKEIKNLDNDPSALVGRSMVKKCARLQILMPKQFKTSKAIWQN